MNKKLIGSLIACAVLVFGVVSCYSYANTVRTTGIQYEAAMAAQYQSNQVTLATQVTKVYEMVDVANLKNDKMDSLLTHAVMGRYGKDGFSAKGAFFTAVTEAYPTLDMKAYDRLADVVQSGRDKFENEQKKLLDMKQHYDVWRNDGLVRSIFVGKSFPSQRLEVRIGSEKYTGKDALDRIGEMVLTDDAVNAFAKGTAGPMDIRHR